MPTTDGVTFNNVFFSPGGRTHWHAHGVGQVLLVKAGKGWVCKDGESPQAIGAGDCVWIAAGERHWHGAAADSYMLHTAVSIGQTAWQDAVTQHEHDAR
jgi:quercetin dioxygenase-like cupin family protein